MERSCITNPRSTQPVHKSQLLLTPSTLQALLTQDREGAGS